MNRREELFEQAFECGIKIKIGSTNTRSAIGIHLLNPSLDELEDALVTAERDNFPCIFVYKE